MKGLTAIFYLLSMVTNASGSSPNPLLKAQNDEVLLAQILSEVISGPLRDQRVTIAMEKDNKIASLVVDVGIKNIQNPVFVLRLPKLKSIYANASNWSEMDFQSQDSSTGYIPVKKSSLVIFSTSINDTWWPLKFPPNDWSPSNIVLISFSRTSCSSRRLLETPLMQQTPRVALVCYYKPPAQAQRQISIRVWTLKPFARGNQLVDLGPWSAESFKTWDQLFIDRFQDMSRKTISILGHPVDRPLFYHSQEGSLKGVNFESMTAVASSLKYKVKFSADYDLSWTDIFESVKRGDTEIFINFAPITPERKEEYDVTVPYLQEGYGMILLVPPPLPRWQSILFPFSWTVWIWIAVSTVCTSITYHIINYQHEKSLLTNVITATKSLLSEAVENVPVSWQSRNFLLVWWIVTMFIHMSYTSNLIAVLTVPVFPVTIQTAKELVDSDNRLCMLDYGDFVPEALAVSTHPTLAALGRVLDMVPLNFEFELDGNEYCMDYVLAGTHAHIDTYSLVKIMYSLVGHGPKVYSLKEQLYPGYLVYLIHKNSPWSYKVNTAVTRLVEAGLIQKWYDNSMDDFKGYFKQDKVSELQPLATAHLQGPFFMFLFGIVCSNVAIAWEFFTFHCFDRSAQFKKSKNVPLE